MNTTMSEELNTSKYKKKYTARITEYIRRQNLLAKAPITTKCIRVHSFGQSDAFFFTAFVIFY